MRPHRRDGFVCEVSSQRAGIAEHPLCSWCAATGAAPGRSDSQSCRHQISRSLVRGRKGSGADGKRGHVSMCSGQRRDRGRRRQHGQFHSVGRRRVEHHRGQAAIDHLIAMVLVRVVSGRLRGVAPSRRVLKRRCRERCCHGITAGLQHQHRPGNDIEDKEPGRPGFCVPPCLHPSFPQEQHLQQTVPRIRGPDKTFR